MRLVFWDKVASPKDYGGLGIRRTREANDVALVTLHWRIFKEGHTDWAKAISFKYIDFKLSSVACHSIKKGTGCSNRATLKRGLSLFNHDSLLLINLINNQCVDDHFLSLIISDCRMLLSCFPQV
ncbi:hypothetical protein ACH5RR_003269, partial [Cinchona calisaya]